MEKHRFKVFEKVVRRYLYVKEEVTREWGKN
jgi:hypothetical protein